MKLRRGDLVWVAVKRPYTGKPRLAFRVQIRRSKWNRLTADSDIMVDKIVTIPKPAIQPESLGRLSPHEIIGLNQALRFWLAL